jgi:hypothetical protein
MPRASSLLEGLVLSSEARPFVRSGDVLIAKTAPFEIPLAVMSAGVSVETIYLGELRRVSRRWVSCLVSTPSTPAQAADVELPTLPTEFSLEKLRGKYPVVSKNTFALLIGGDARGYNYSQSDWQLLVKKIVAFSKYTGVVWRVATSPRTPAFVDELLLKTSCEEPSAFRQVSVYSASEKVSMLDCLADSSCAVVTEDSASMISECVNVHLPVLSVSPLGAVGSHMTKGQVSHFEADKRLLCANIHDLDIKGFCEWVDREFCPVENEWGEVFRKYVIKNMGG